MRKIFKVAAVLEVASTLLLSPAALAGSGSIVSYGSVKAGGGVNANSFQFLTVNDTVTTSFSGWCISGHDPLGGVAAQNVRDSRDNQTLIFFVDGTVTPPSDSGLIANMADCPYPLRYVYGVRN